MNDGGTDQSPDAESEDAQLLKREGRVLCVILALYAFGVFGYVTAALATFFVGRDADSVDAELAGAKQLAELRAEVIALRDEIRALSQRPLGK